MGHGWKNVNGGKWASRDCLCGKGKVDIYISDHEESDYSSELRGATYSRICKCPEVCEKDISYSSTDKI